MRPVERVSLGIVILAASAFAARTGRAQFSTGITTEANEHYENQVAYGYIWPNLPNAPSNCSGFLSNMEGGPGISYVTQHVWLDGSVFGTDFRDPERSSSSSDDDTDNFDQNGAAISYYCGHGYSWGGTENACVHDAEDRKSVV